MRILGIETSCDETAVAVVENGQKVICNVIFSSVFAHKRFGGVVPEIAVRAHSEKINWVLKKAKINFAEIDIVAVAYGPGLIGSLLVGTSFAKALTFSKGIRLLKINHLIAHLYSPFLHSFSVHPAAIDFNRIFPAVGMVVSGGHTNLIYLKSFENYQLLGQTRDDAAGEAFDKVAKILNLGYPGGPIIEKLALKGDANRIKFNCARLKGSFDFSFSGIKTAVLYKVKGHKGARSQERIAGDLAAGIPDIAASFQKAVVDVLVEKSVAACLSKKCRNLILGGGVTANSYLKKRVFETALRKKINLFYPAFEFCTDNAAMLAGLAYHLNNEKHFADLDLTPSANLGV